MRSIRLIVAIVLPAVTAAYLPVMAKDGDTPPRESRGDVPVMQWAVAPRTLAELPRQEDPAPSEPKPETLEPAQPPATTRLSDTPAEQPSPDEPTPAAVPGLTLEELVEMAMESNPTLMQAAVAVEAAQGRYVQASLYPNPALAYQGGDIGLDGTSGQQGMGVSQEIITSNKRIWAMAVAESEVQQARLAWESQRRRVVNGVRSAYYDLLLAQKTIDVNQELVRIGQEGVGLAEKLLEARAVSKAEVLQTQIETQMAELSLYQAKNRHDGAWRRLTAVMGKPEMQPQSLAGEVDKNLPRFNWKDTLEHLLTQSPELAQALAAVETARNDLALQCASRIPNIGVAAGVKYDESARFTLADVGISVPLPLFNRNQGNILAAQADLAAAQNEVRRLELELRDRLAEAFEQYANASRQVEVYSGSIVPNAEESLQLATKGYRVGEFAYFALLTAQRTYFGVSLEYLESLKEFWARSVELEGMLLSGGLERPE